MSRYWIVLMALALSVSAFAGPAGKYRQEIRNPFRDEAYTLVRTLNLNADGKAELYSEYKGDKPQYDQSVRDSLGSLMREVRDSRKIKHSGNWRLSGDRIFVELRRLEAGDDERNLSSSFEFDRNGDELRARSQDSSRYGDRTIRMAKIEDWSDQDQGGDDLDPKKFRGTYGWGDVIRGEKGDTYFIRRLKLSGERSAEMISEYDGSKPVVGKGSLDDFGVLFAEVVSNRKITHKGKWREDKGKIYVELTKVGGGDFAQNVTSSFVFDPRGEELVLLEGDKTDYGSRSFRLRKDWRSDDLPGRPDTKPSFDQPTYLELDRTATGGGMLAHAGTKARDLDEIRLILSKNGNFELRVRGDANAIFRGVYDVRRDNSIQLEAREAFGVSATGNGEAELDRKGQLGKVMLRGEAKGRRFTLTFTAR